MYTSPSVLQCARTVDIGLFRKTGWPARAWWSRSSTTTTSLTNFTSLGVMRPENRGEIVSVYNLQWVARIPRADAAAVLGEAKPIPIGSGYPPLSWQNRTHGSSWSENGAQRYSLPGGGIEKGGGPSGGVLVKGRVLIQKKELSGHNWRNRKDPPKAGTWRSEVQS